MDFFQAAQREAQWFFCLRCILRLFVERCDDRRVLLRVVSRMLGHFAEVGITLRILQAVDHWCQLGNGAGRITRSLRAQLVLLSLLLSYLLLEPLRQCLALDVLLGFLLRFALLFLLLFLLVVRA